MVALLPAAALAEPVEPTNRADDPSLGELQVQRFGGSDRIGTAAIIAGEVFGGAETAVLARADDYADALAGATLAVEHDGPLLLTPRGELDERVADTLQTLGVEEAFVLGGAAALSSSIDRALDDLDIEVNRLAGDDRFETAIKVAEQLPDQEVDTAYLVEGRHADPARGWPDAVAVSALAAAEGSPILLTDHDQLAPATVAALEHVDEVEIIGGSAAVSDNVETHVATLAQHVGRTSGRDRYETSLELAERHAERSDQQPDTAWLATGQTFPDALTAGANAATTNSLLLLADTREPSVQGDATLDWLQGRAGQLRGLTFIGGAAVMSDQFVDSIVGPVREEQERIAEEQRGGDGRDPDEGDEGDDGNEPDPGDDDDGSEPDDPDEGDGASPEPGDGEPASEVSRHGITWTFDDEYPVGRYANGDYWVQGPVDIVDIDPASQNSSGGRTINGSMINPSPEDGSSTGYGQTRDTGYDPSLNVADGVSTSDPLTVEPDSSLVSAISVDEDDARPGLESAAVLTVVDQPPPEDSFRPAYSSDDTTATHTTNDLDYDLLPDLDPVDGAPDPTDLASDFERVWLDHVPGWNGRAIHPTTNMPGYGRDMASKLGQGSLALMLDHPTEQKHDLLVNYVQIGIDFHGIVDNGGEENWVPNGGHAQGRKWPILFAGQLLDDPTMATIGDRDDVYFGEDAQTFHVTQTEIDREGNHADPDHRHYNPDYSDGYTQDMLGMPEWGQRHATDPNRDTPDPGRSYRQCCTAASWHGHVLSARLMDLQDAWNHDPLFDYSDRYLGETTDPAWPNLNPTGSNRFSDRPFTENMWHTHR
ncbi:cell wall-binding repeat-containing protein [Egibacter rhizosphaerae]|nr:cell wall-binding repeat-containing protein [Egibacter rhizosphaerae]